MVPSVPQPSPQRATPGPKNTPQPCRLPHTEAKGVADRVPEHIRALVYLDAFVLEDGENQMQHLSEAYFRQFREGANDLEEGW